MNSKHLENSLKILLGVAPAENDEDEEMNKWRLQYWASRLNFFSILVIQSSNASVADLVADQVRVAKLSISTVQQASQPVTFAIATPIKIVTVAPGGIHVYLINLPGRNKVRVERSSIRFTADGYRVPKESPWLNVM